MKPDRAAIDLSFPHPVFGTFTPIKIHLEYPLAPGQTEEDAWDHGKKSMEEWFMSRYPPLDLGFPAHTAPPKYEQSQTSSTIPVISKDPEERRIGMEIADIYSCQDLKILQSYKLIAKSKPELQAAYDQQYKKLTNQTP